MNIFSILTAIFVVLKLTGEITIAWWQVFIPVYIWVILEAILMIIKKEEE